MRIAIYHFLKVTKDLVEGKKSELINYEYFIYNKKSFFIYLPTFDNWYYLGFAEKVIDCRLRQGLGVRRDIADS